MNSIHTKLDKFVYEMVFGNIARFSLENQKKKKLTKTKR